MQKKLGLLCTCTLFVSVAVAQISNMDQSSKKEKKLLQRVDALHKAIFQTKDSLVLKSLVHEKVTYGHSGGAIEDKTAMIHKAVTSPTAYKNITQGKLSTSFIKKTAIVRIILRATSIESGNESPLDLSILQVWIKKSGNWQILARQAVKIASKKQ
ncbi:MAG TPA: nuclear transport factor 2 family protein [Segetibacter sp.]|jgi:hypothetical protein